MTITPRVDLIREGGVVREGGVEARVERAAAQVEQVTQALLAKAFRGELVPET